MGEKLLKLYAFIFGRAAFYKFNHMVYHFGLRGMGVLNHYSGYLAGEEGWIREYIATKTNPIIIDVGANKGGYSQYILNLCPNATILAFEPHPQTFKMLCKTIQATNFKPFNLGAGDKAESLILYDYDAKEGSEHASLYKDVIQDLHSGKASTHPVDVVRLDDFLKNQNISNIDLLKIDTEGNEFNVLLGAKELLQSNGVQAIHFEFNEMNIVSKTTFKDFWGLLSSYTLYRLMPGGKLLEIKQYSAIDCEIFGYQNIIALLKKSS